MRQSKKKYIIPDVKIIKISDDQNIITSGPVPPTPDPNSFGTIRDGYKIF